MSPSSTYLSRALAPSSSPARTSSSSTSKAIINGVHRLQSLRFDSEDDGINTVIHSATGANLISWVPNAGAADHVAMNCRKMLPGASSGPHAEPLYTLDIITIAAACRQLVVIDLSGAAHRVTDAAVQSLTPPLSGNSRAQSLQHCGHDRYDSCLEIPRMPLMCLVFTLSCVSLRAGAVIKADVEDGPNLVGGGGPINPTPILSVWGSKSGTSYWSRQGLSGGRFLLANVFARFEPPHSQFTTYFKFVVQYYS
ncbi:hypothetical protein BDK51DRAFT_48351 [Blyttiomyces helicus]|uniref:Uncharacterized protein n=1 Tax=Blyttiomyces helicus TaxID=388810 RepID=A0A4P9W0G0_9FUNG|nr:hypothetical protein BDK51DRAFT_48351 [Blyttiomyces helicus]|eukprot:RKO85122.1 hypothetical protein BDK51DRAFT_48351 [Blyttiomyces helicus]